jgi:hypothetical protein
MTINLNNPLRMLRSGLGSLNQRITVLSGSLLNRVKNKPVVAREVAEGLSEKPIIYNSSEQDPFTALALKQAKENPPTGIPINDDSLQ